MNNINRVGEDTIGCVNIINIRFKYSNIRIHTVSDVEYSNSDMDRSKLL